jgi:eukaryotic-like serine/threonine-protein kinase
MAEGDQQRAANGIRRSASKNMPDRIGKYRIDHVIGSGSLGIVYKGHDEQIDRSLAIKTLRPEILEDVEEGEEFMRRFAAEARSAGRCLHPNIVTVFDFVEHRGAPYIVMEYVDAGTLEQVIRSGARLPIRQVGEVMAQLLFALDHANSRGVIHRDVKPANILCPSAASIKVTDFGLAHLETLGLTDPGTLGSLGTPNYMAPERFLGRPADARSDLFSAGVILFQMLTGAKPFIAVDVPELMRKLMSEFPPSVQLYRPELGPEIDAAVQRALARNPEDRFQTADEFVDSLNTAIGTRPSDNLLPLDLFKLSRAPNGGTSSRGTSSRENSSRETSSRETSSGETSSGDTSSPEASGDPEKSLDQAMAEKLAPSTIDALERSLARSLGPIARFFVKQASHETTSAEMLLTALAGKITTKAEADTFRRDAEQALRDDPGVARAPQEADVSEAEVVAATEMLLKLIGPIARVVVARQARTAVGRDDFYRQLASAIPNEQDRAGFLTIRGKLNRPGIV